MTDAVLVWVTCGMIGLLSACQRVPNVRVILGAPHVVPKVWTELVGRALIGGPIVLLLEVATRMRIPTTKETIIRVFLGMLGGAIGGYVAYARFGS